MALDDGACGPLLYQKGGIFPTTKEVEVIEFHRILNLTFCLFIR